MRNRTLLAAVLVALSIAAGSATHPTTQPRSIHETIKTLRIGTMTEGDVTAIMGEPDRSLRESNGTALYFESMKYVVRCFIGADGKLAAVDERQKY